MKKKSWCCILAVIVMLMTVSTGALAQSTKASEYIITCFAEIVPEKNGEFDVEFDIAATGYMKTLGVQKIEVFSLGGGRLALYESTDSNYADILLTQGAFRYSNAVDCKGVPGRSYYAVVTFYAGDNTGSDTVTFTTDAQRV